MELFNEVLGNGPLTLPLPPSRNRLTRVGVYGHYPSRAYQDWLELAAPMLYQYLLFTDWGPPRDGWFRVRMDLYVGARYCDADAYSKALLDLLGGAQVGDGGKIVRTGAVYKDDKQVRTPHPDLIETHLPADQTRVVICWDSAEPPKRYVKPKAPRKGR